MVPLSAYLILSGILFTVGVIGFLVRRNLIVMFMSIELIVSGAKRDVLQDAIALVRKSITDFPLQYQNFRD